MRLVYGYDQIIADWVSQHIPQMAGDGFGPCAAVGVEHGGALLGGCVYHNYRPKFRDVEMSFASVDTRWLIGPRGDRFGVIRGLMSVPFDQLGVYRVTALTPKRCKSARQFIDKFGFKREGAHKMAFGDDDAISSALYEPVWRSSKWAMPPVQGTA